MFIIMYCLYPLLSSYVDSSQYDQRQTGDVNVQVDLKDVQIFALFRGKKEEYVDYDYAYDYSELTIKPHQNRTTPKPFNGTRATTQRIDTIDNSTKTTTVLQEYTITPMNNESTTSDFTATTIIPADLFSTTTQRSFDSTTENFETTKIVSVIPAQTLPRNNCRKGYIMNQKGQCQLKLNTNENALLRLVKLSQKLKLRRENKTDNKP